VPVVDDPVALKVALGGVSAEKRLLLAETEQENSLRNELAREPLRENLPVALAIGPEGGWTAEEMALFGQNGWRPVTLGPRILRAETAAIAALAVCAAMLQGS
jgi:16S rRNA (uracil1498-N3)-methyltransferase